VRSSAIGEDGEHQSFAGEFRTLLEVDRAGLAAAIAAVRTSYAGRPGGVVVQAMVPAEYAGVMFTEDPAHAGRVLIEAVAGLGEGLVSGTATPTEHRVGRVTGAVAAGEPAPIDVRPLVELGRALERRFGADSVFRDVDDIAAGADFGVVIEQALQQVQAVLVVIGTRWLDARDGRGRRLDDPGDYVRREVELALASGKPLIPVLVGGATMPAAEALPATLRGLANRNALALGDAGWAADLARLEAALAQWVAPPVSPAPVRGRRALAAAIAALVLALGGGWWWLRDGDGGLQAIVGAWSAEVAYPWNLTLREHYVFTLEDGREVEVRGDEEIEYDGEAVAWGDGRLRFLTRSETVSGNEPPREMGQLYEVWREGETLCVRLQIRRSHSVDAALEFTAQRQ